MPVNRNALIRYKTIDKCLQNKYRKWTLDDLIAACSEALYEYEGIDKGVSRRTVQADIQLMRSDKLGYNAPIRVVDRKFYAYEDPDYSITNIPLSEHDLERLNETVEFLKQFKGFSHFKELDSLVQKFEDHVYSKKTNNAPVIDFEKNEDLKGLEFLDVIYQAIINRQTVIIMYQSFKARFPDSFVFHPYLLKEFRNRWFVLGVKNKQAGILTLALDRIIEITKSETPFFEKEDFSAAEYYKNAIGVTVSENLPPEEVLLFVTQKHAPYVLTKPLHTSQKLVEKDNFGIVISLRVQHNFELEKEILGFGDGMKVISPNRLKRAISGRISDCLDLYNSELNESGLRSVARKLRQKGFGILNFVYTQREVNRIKKEVDKVAKDLGNIFYLEIENLPALKSVLINKKLKRIVESVAPDAQLISCAYSQKEEQVGWQQMSTFWADTDASGFSLEICLDDSNEGNGAAQVVPGSNRRTLTASEITAITENCTPVSCTVHSGGILLLDSKILRTVPNHFMQKKKRVIHLNFVQ